MEKTTDMARTPELDRDIFRLIEETDRRCTEIERAGLSPEERLQRGMRSIEVAGTRIDLQGASAGNRVGRVDAFGFERTVMRSDFDEILGRLIEEQVVTIRFRGLPGDQAKTIAGWLAATGFTRRFREKFWIASTVDAPDPLGSFDIRSVSAGDLPAFVRIIAVNYRFDPGRDLEAFAREFHGPENACFMAYENGEAIATGRLLRSGAACIFGYGTTMSRHRKRGIQSEMIAARLRYARDSGCLWATASTWGSDRSSRNLARQGFREAYEAPVYTRTA